VPKDKRHPRGALARSNGGDPENRSGKTADTIINHDPHYNPPKEPLNIIHQDDHILVLSKPAGLLSVPGRHPDNKDSLQSRVIEEFPTALLVHRLDMATSGLMIMALNKPAQSHLSRQFQQRKTQKTYIAKVWGHVEGDSGTIDLPIRCDWPNRPLQMVCYEHGKPSQTQWEVIERAAAHTTLKLSPITGRTHQLRIHLKSIGHPILGDEFYAQGEAFTASERLCLHAERLVVEHPVEGGQVEFIHPANIE